MVERKNKTGNFRLKRKIIYGIIKRVFDFTFSFIFLIILCPILILTALIIFVSSGSPVIYTQNRIGKDEKKFIIYKFRTMKKNARLLEKKGVKRDKLVIPLGYSLRVFHVDELLQLLNILKGDMSFIGPRPLIPDEYNSHVNWDSDYSKVMENRPGLTSINNALGYMEDERRYKTMKKIGLRYTSNRLLHRKTSKQYHRKLKEREFFYHNNFSFLLDTKIIWWTFLIEVDAAKKIMRRLKSKFS
jgi:lipopolysaccharide/colanic/teichoic acid biosynthesis glycosyltransferase